MEYATKEEVNELRKAFNSLVSELKEANLTKPLDLDLEIYEDDEDDETFEEDQSEGTTKESQSTEEPIIF